MQGESEVVFKSLLDLVMKMMAELFHCQRAHHIWAMVDRCWSMVDLPC